MSRASGPVGVTAEATNLSIAAVGASIPVTRVTVSPDTTVGLRFYVTRALRCVGVRFFWLVPSGSKTVKVSLWNASNTRLANASGDVTGASGAVNEIFFSSPQTLAVGSLYRVSAYQTDAGAYCKATLSGVYDAAIPGRPFHMGSGVVVTQGTLYGAGDVHPGSTAGTEGYAVEPIVVV